MKATIYIFGNFANGYSQYPDNYTHNLFEVIGKSRQAESEIIYHREGALIYYIYTREISKIDNTFIGLCYVFNDVFIKDFTPLFSIFEDVITNIVVTGELLEFTNDGKLATKINQLYTHTKELQRVSDYLNNKLNSLGGKTEKLPPINFAISTAEWKSYSYKDVADIQKSVVDYSNIRVLKGEEYNTDTLSSYAGKLNTLNNEKTAALRTIDKQKQEISDLKKKQKNYKLVIWLIVFICIGGIIFISTINSRNTQIQNLKDDIQEQQQQIETQTQTIEEINSDLSNAKIEITSLNQTIQEQTDNIQSLQIDIENKNQTISTLNTTIREQDISITKLREDNSDLSKIKKELSDLKNYIKNELPLIITDIEIANADNNGNIDTDYGRKIYGSRTMYFKPRIKYIGFISDYKTLKVKWYTPDGSLSTGNFSPEGFSQSETYYIMTESNTLTLLGWGNKNKGHWKKGTYRIEIWYEDICLKAKTFTVY